MARSEFLKRTEQQLMRRRDALRKALAGDRGLLETAHEAGVGDEVDAAVFTEQSELRSQMASFESRELAQIEAALAKIRAGRYGRCETCDKAIAPIRLKALPYATECIVCARREEHRGAAAPRAAGVNRIAAYTTDSDKEPTLDDAEFEEIR